MMEWLKRKFTNWFVKKGYSFGYDFSNIETIDGVPFGDPPACFKCPIWVRWLAVYLFSPSIYMYEIGNSLCEAISEGFHSDLDLGFKINNLASVKEGERLFVKYTIENCEERETSQS